MSNSNKKSNELLIVAGLSLKNLQPLVWDSSSEYFLPDLRAVMLSYADFPQMPLRRRQAMTLGLRVFLGIPKKIKTFLDNGAFYFANQIYEVPMDEYEEFVEATKPDWRPIPRDFIPFPQMAWPEQELCFNKTMNINLNFQHNGYVPIVHIRRYLNEYMQAVCADENLSRKTSIALGGIVPNLLRKPSAMPYIDILKGLLHVRDLFKGKSIHVFGVGGTATLHLIALMGFDSVDSGGWRNRAARGIVQLPGSGERMVAELGNWRGRRPSGEEWQKLRKCRCPACLLHGLDGLKASKLEGFCNRATHNLWILLQEAKWLKKHIKDGTYKNDYRKRLDNSTYRPLIAELLKLLEEGNLRK